MHGKITLNVLCCSTKDTYGIDEVNITWVGDVEGNSTGGDDNSTNDTKETNDTNGTDKRTND